MRPASIVQFERLFLAALGLDAIANLLSWNASIAAAKTYSQFAGVAPTLVSCAMAGFVVLGLALWYFAARRASAVAKWIVAGWFVVSTVLLALSLFHGFSFALPVVIGWVAYILRAWSVSHLFTPEAEAWFARPE